MGEPRDALNMCTYVAPANQPCPWSLLKLRRLHLPVIATAVTIVGGLAGAITTWYLPGGTSFSSFAPSRSSRMRLVVAAALARATPWRTSRRGVPERGGAETVAPHAQVLVRGVTLAWATAKDGFQAQRRWLPWNRTRSMDSLGVMHEKRVA